MLVRKLIRMHQETAMPAIAKQNILRMEYRHQCSSDITYTSQHNNKRNCHHNQIFNL